MLDRFAHRVDSRANTPAIGFELGLAWSSGADAAAKPRQGGTGANQARQQILQLRQLHLELALASLRAPRKDVQNQLRAIDDLP